MIVTFKKIYSCFEDFFYNEGDISIFSWNVRKSSANENYLKKQNQKYYEILTINECIEKLSIIIGCNIWMICLELNWFFYDPSWTFQFSEFLWTVCASAWVVFNNFLFIDATDRSKISSNIFRHTLFICTVKYNY